MNKIQPKCGIVTLLMIDYCAAYMYKKGKELYRMELFWKYWKLTLLWPENQNLVLLSFGFLAIILLLIILFINRILLESSFHCASLTYSPFHKTLPIFRLQMHWIPARILWNGRYQTVPSSIFEMFCVFQYFQKPRKSFILCSFRPFLYMPYNSLTQLS